MCPADLAFAGLKLSTAEMTELQRTTADAGSEWKNMLQAQFGRIALERVNVYLDTGLIGPYENDGDKIWPI